MENEDLVKAEAERSRIESIRIAKQICDFITNMDVNNKSHLDHLQKLILIQSKKMSPIEKMELNRKDMEEIAYSIVSDDLEVVHRGLMKSLHTLGKLFITM